MALERSPILPKGFYWIDVIGLARIDLFSRWRNTNAAAVKVRASNDFPDEDPPRQWILFEVLAPTPWLDAKQMGFPTIGKAGMNVGDTVQRPDPERDPLDKLGDELNVSTLASGVKTAGIVAVVAWFLLRLLKR